MPGHAPGLRRHRRSHQPNSTPAASATRRGTRLGPRTQRDIHPHPHARTSCRRSCTRSTNPANGDTPRHRRRHSRARRPGLHRIPDDPRTHQGQSRREPTRLPAVLRRTARCSAQHVVPHPPAARRPRAGLVLQPALSRRLQHGTTPTAHRRLLRVRHIASRAHRRNRIQEHQSRRAHIQLMARPHQSIQIVR